jgi:Domain of unknown function (DUF3854)
MTASYPNPSPRTLSDSHRRQLLEESGISPGVAEERGYYTARKRSEVPDLFKDYQRRVGLVIPVLTPSGDRRARLRPDRPRKGKDGRIRKYEQAGGVGCALDVHPRNLERLSDPTVPLWVVEGEKKGDALTSKGECAVALPGVWNWQRSGELLPDWKHIELAGRLVYICFDSDAWSNPNVQLALERLAVALQDLGAKVLAVHLEDAPDGSKMGADDYLVAGGTVAELKIRARKFDPAEVGRIRMSKDEQLRCGLEDLKRRYWAFEWKGMGGDTAQDVYLKLIEAAGRYGKIHADGIRVVKAQGPLALESKVSTRTLWKVLGRLESWGLIYRDNEDRKPDRSGAFVLRAGVSHKGSSTSAEEKVTPQLQKCDPGDLHLRAPRLRWSAPGWKPGRKTRRKYRLGEISRLPEARERIRRLGKGRGHILDGLDAAGGTLTLAELCEVLHRSRPRDIRRRNLPMLEDAGIIQVDGDTVSLTEDWLEALRREREHGKELEAEELAAERYRIKSRAFHRRHEAPKSRPSAAGLANVRASREKRAAHTEEKPAPVAESERRIARLIREGMARRWAEKAVYKAPPDPEPARKMPREVNGVYVHGAECDCEWCAEELEPRYASVRRSA